MRFRADSYAIANATACCPACGQWTHVVAIALPPNHSVQVDEVQDEEAWQPVAPGVWLFYVEELPDAAHQQLQALASGYRQVSDEAAGLAHWANHCEHCDARQDEHDLHCEPGGAFVGWWANTEAALSWLGLVEPIEVQAGGYTYEPES
jgi:hypothetical protein